MSIELDEQRFRKLRLFLAAHAHWPRAYHRFTVSRKCGSCRSAKDKLLTLFRSALSSNTGGGISRNAYASRNFAKKVRGLPNRRTVSSKAFLHCFGVSRPDQLLHQLTTIHGVGLKKAALFLRDLYITQSLAANHRTLTDELLSADDLLIPFDRVIATGLNKVLCKPLLTPSSALQSVNEFFKRRDDLHHMLIEDLWFWGFFGLVGPGYDRDIEINRDKIALDPFFDVYEVPRRQLNRFGNIISP